MMKIIYCTAVSLLLVVMTMIAAIGGYQIAAFIFFMSAALMIAIPLIFDTSPKASQPPVSYGCDDHETTTVVHRHEHHYHNYNDITEGTETCKELPDGTTVTTRHVKRWN